ncbi:MAG: transcriptional repressor [Candidatus Moraniibacteriota bacterium]
MEATEIEGIIRKRNGRMTRIRKAVLDIFRTADTPITATFIMEALAKRRIAADRTTIYRELRFLTETGVIREVRLAGRGRSFELSHGHRHHLVCLGCDAVKSIPFDEHLYGEEKRLLEDERFRVLDHSLAFYGYCDKCS